MTTKLFKSMNIIRCVSGANLNLFRYTAIDGNHSGVVTATSYGASDEHPMSTRSASDGSTRNTRGNLIGVWKYAAMLLCLLTLGVGNAWAGHGGACTAKLQVNKGTGNGTVYAATTSSATSGSSSVSAGCGNSDSGTHTHTFYAFATPAAGYTFLGWTESTTSTAGADASNPKAVTITSNSHGTVTKTLYAHFVEKAKVNITFEAPANGTYTIAVNGGSAETVSSADVVKNNVEGVVLTATPASGYAFAGWYKLNSAGEFVEDLSIANPYNASFTTSETLKMGARFVPVTLGKFILKGSDTQYYGLKMATVAAGGSGTIVPVADETLVDGSDLMPFDNGTYSIKAGATLLVPYSSANIVQTAPQIITTAATLSAYKTLVFTDGVNVECDGTICVGGQIMAGSGGSMSSYVSGPCGMINMANGGHIELNSGAKLYCWGFIKGQDMDQGNNTVGVGTITANSGAEVWENLGIGDWRGGTATSNIKNTRFFPFQSYFIQNIEVPLTIEYGAAEKNYIALNATGGPYNTSATTIGSSKALFLLKDANSAFRKWYDPTTDLTCFELSGTSQIDELSITIDALFLSIDVKSSDFDLPINSSMHIILTNSSVTLSKPMVLQPGAVIEVKNDANITLSSNAYLYDKDNWGAYAGPDYYFHSYPNLTSHKNRGNGKSNALLDDAKVIVDGTVSVTGKLYSTASGANVMGNGGGEIVFSSSLPTATTIPAFTSNGDAVSGGVAVNNANLCNEDESYTKAIASTTFHNVNGRWFKSGNQNENADHTYNFTYIASGAVSGTGGTDVSPNTNNAVYAPDKTGLAADMKWCNVEQDGTCSNIFNATQALNETPASDIRYTYPSDSWLQLLKTETEGVYGGSDNSLYAVDGCAVNSLGSVDENCLYTINDVKKALVDGHFVALEKNTEDEAWHDVANPTNYYISFAGCTWHPATKYAGEEKAYIVEDGNYIWYNNDWLLVEREDPFFFDYNEQNVKRYYEYDNGAWVLASPRVRVEDALEIRDFYKLPEAITVASGKKNATITILKDISGINTRMTYTAKNTTCTLDLNGHTVSGAAPFGDDNNRGLLIINASGTTFTITDNSANKEGRLENICNQNKVTYTVHLMAGTLNLEHGTIHAENPAQYASKAATVNNVAVTALTACGARGIQVNAAQKLNITGGRTEAFATRNAYGIAAAGNAANTTLVTVTGGEIYAEAPAYVYGINCSGKLNISNGLVEAKLNDHLVDASYAADNASYNLNAHRYCYGINMTASANATASSCYFGTLTMTGGTVNASSDLARRYDSYVYGVRVARSETGAGNNKIGADGTKTQQANAKASITGAAINATSAGGYVYGVYVEGSYNSYDKTHSVVSIQNSNITSKASYYAYGVLANATVNGSYGSCVAADVELTNNTVLAETIDKEVAYALYCASASNTVYQNDATYSYYAGEYAIGAKMTINSGTYTAKTKTTNAYAVVSSTRSKSTYGSETNVATERKQGGNAEAYATLIIHGGTFRGEATTTTSRAVSSGGITTIDGGTFEAYSTSTTAYGLYAVSGKLTATGVTVTASATGTAYGAVADASIPSGNTAQTGFAYAGELELNNCNITATTRTSTEARGVFVNATNKMHNWKQFQADSTSYKWATTTYNAYKSVFLCTVAGHDSVGIAIAGRATINGGTITATAATTTAYGVYSVNSFSTNLDSIATPDLVVRNATITAKTNGTTTAYGIYAQGETTIDGCDITVQPKTTTGYGIMALNYQDTVRVSNTTVRVTTTHPTSSTSDATAYGIYGYVDINATNGLERHGNFILGEGNDVTSTITSGKTSYAVFLNATKRAITTTGGAYRPGDYATAATAIINGGDYNATATSGAYALVMQGKQTQGSVTAAPQVTVNGGKFNGKTAETGIGGLVGYEQLLGGYFAHNTNLAMYAVAPKSVWTLPTTHEEYANGYRYKIAEIYTITFKNGSTELQSGIMEAGTTPTYSGTPTKDADAQYTYTFDGWSTTDGGDKLAALPAVSANATYYAHFAQSENKYSVSIEAGANGSVSLASVSEIGCETASGEITATPNVGYSFSGWTLPTGVTLAEGYELTSNPVRIHATAADKTITANFVPRTDINYTVKHWQQNLDNNEYTEYESEGKKGTTATPTAAAAKSYTGFTAQSFEQGTIAGNGSTIVNIYYNRNTFTITWLDGNGNAVETDENVKYGATPEYNGETPAKAATAQYTYTFSGWDSAIVPVAGDATYTAQFSSTVNKYHITWLVKLNGETLESKEEYVEYGQTPSYGSTPTKEQTESQVFTFSGWTPEVASVTGDQEYIGSFNVAPRPYKITFVNDNGVELWHSDFGYGSTPSYGGSTPVSSHTGDGYTYTFIGWTPSIEAVNGDTTYIATYSRSKDKIIVNTQETVTNNTTASTTTVENGGTLTVGTGNEDITLQSTTIIVEAGGQLDVEAEGSIEADVFIIQATTEEQGEEDAKEEVQVSGELSETGSKNLQTIYYDLTRKHGTEKFLARVWYAVAVPWAVETPNYSDGGVFIKRGEEFIPQRLGATFDLISYDGECRAKNGASANCWVYLEDEPEEVMVPGKLYMIYLTEETSTIRFKKKAGNGYPIHTNSLTVSAHAETKPNDGKDANWNGIANPATYRAYMNVDATNNLAQRFIPGTKPREDGHYEALDLNDKQAVGQPLFVQVDPNAGTSVVVSRTNNKSAHAPLRAQAAEDNNEVRYAIGIAANGKLADRLYIQTADEKEDKYTIGKDMSKMGTSSYVAQIWVNRYDSKLCLSTMELTDNQADYPLDIYAPQAGEYMIFAPADVASGDNIYLTRDGIVVWNLTIAPYNASLDKGTISRYGLRIVRSNNAPSIATGVDEIRSDNPQCTKVFMDNHVYILRGEELYTITGQKAK